MVTVRNEAERVKAHGRAEGCVEKATFERKL